MFGKLSVALLVACLICELFLVKMAPSLNARYGPAGFGEAIGALLVIYAVSMIVMAIMWAISDRKWSGGVTSLLFGVGAAVGMTYLTLVGSQL